MTNQSDEDDWETDDTEPSDEVDGGTITYDVLSYPADWTLKVFYDKFTSGNVSLPTYQRGYVWDQARASRLIESFLLGLPVPGVFLFREKDTNKFQIVDGHQRIGSVVRYFKGTFDDRPFRLRKVNRKWSGKLFTDLSEPDRLQLEDTVLRATVIQEVSATDRQSIYSIFERLNTGGVGLSAMEIRKCIYHGDLFDLLERLNEDLAWRRLLGKEKPDKRLRDVELLLRVVALWLQVDRYEKPMKRFLNNFMHEYRSGAHSADPRSMEAIAREFRRAVKQVVDALPEKPFHLRGPLNLAVVDSVMAVFLKQEVVRDDVADRFERLKHDAEFKSSVSISTSDKDVVLKRFELARRYLVD